MEKSSPTDWKPEFPFNEGTQETERETIMMQWRIDGMQVIMIKSDVNVGTFHTSLTRIIEYMVPVLNSIKSYRSGQS